MEIQIERHVLKLLMVDTNLGLAINLSGVGY